MGFEASLEKLLDEETLEQTAIVANCRMNRERELRGTNGYEVELGLDPAAWLARRGAGRWLDVCCGSGRALLQAEPLLPPSIELVGLDLVGFFCERPARSRVVLVEAPLRTFTPGALPLDLITCVHGLHYVGDKLGALQRLGRWLAPDGLLLAHLDLDNVLLEGRPRRRQLLSWLRQAGFGYDSRRHLITLRGPCRPWPLAFLGARASGPNYTGQPAVESHYRIAD